MPGDFNDAIPTERIMKKKKVICFRLLGSTAYAEGAAEQENTAEYRGVPGKIGKKTLSFLQYLIVNHTRNISAEELIDTFWGEGGSSDPANALRNMLFKIRGVLKDMFPEEGEMLKTLQGFYAWDSGIQIKLDCEGMERACLEAKRSTGGNDGEQMELLRRAVSLYHGDFLAGNDSEWVQAPRQYYRTLYLDACKALLPMLERKEEWTEIVRICAQAYQTDFSIEEFTACQMRAFIAIEQPEEAIKRYDIFRRRMLRELEMPPTENIEQIYTLALGLRKKGRADEREIFRMVSEGNEGKRAFFCSFGTFQSIVTLERRHLARSRQSSTLVIVSLDGGAAPTTDMRRLERILQEGLRAGDPVARLAAGSYILMLTGTDTDHARIVISRLDCSFHKIYRHSSARLTFRLSALDPEEQKVEKNA